MATTASAPSTENSLSFDSKIEFNVWPNPFVSKINLTIPDFDKSAEVNIFTINGAKILSKTVFSAKSEINTSDLPNGNYIISVESGDKINRKKLVK
ncbi:MAG: T9SS type A sorting domain-containing protein [Chloroflexia bacterium]|nr:T9SS type A sorting domain-containing protein [Chloroflexia bacterium]